MQGVMRENWFPVSWEQVSYLSGGQICGTQSHHMADNLMTETKKTQKASNFPPLIKLSEVDQFSKVVVRKLVLFEVPQADHVVS